MGQTANDRERAERGKNLLMDAMELNGFTPLESLVLMMDIIVKSHTVFGSRESIVELGRMMLLLFDSYTQEKNEEI